MSDLIAIVYPTEAKAAEVRQRLFKLQKEYLITLGDAVIATKTESGQVKLKNDAPIKVDNRVQPADSAHPTPQEH